VPYRNRVSSSVFQANAASSNNVTKAGHNRFIALPDSRYIRSWCTGEDSNLRSSKERQIYSLLPLTTRPPVRFGNALCSAQTNSRAAFSRHCGNPRREYNLQTLNRAIPAVLSARRALRGQKTIPTTRSNYPFGRLPNWSWRRDLNPRPSDYKSDALPTELRQQKPLNTVYLRAPSQATSPSRLARAIPALAPRSPFI
jgi:hypothetical protein